MKRAVFITLLLSIVLTLAGQRQPGGQRPESKPANYYKLEGFRHGVSFFPQANLKQVEYKAGDSLTFDRYHTSDVVYEWLRRWTARYPDLLEMYEVGRSYENRPVYQVTLTNKKTGADTEKPAAFFEGGRHSGEVTAVETVMWMLKYFLDNYGKDPVITHIIDTKTIYLRPVNNPDGHNLYLQTAQSNRSTVRPYDNDGDGLLDEDAPEDIDGDGMILQMRWKDEKNGTMIPDPDDPTGRLMKRVAAGKGIYSVASEGIDNDGDGRLNEDGIGGLDLHRNYPENWRPESEATGRGYTQGGAGDYPLSETETRAVVTFLLSHPNVYVVNSMDTSVPMHLRPPSTSASEERMYPEDLKWYKLFDETGKKITGYAKAGDVYNDYGGGSPLFGHGPDFGYFYFGAIWYGDEIWNGARNKDYDGNGTIEQKEILRWDDEENDSLGFRRWKPAHHPVYGDVEIGGFDPKFFSQNPPAKHLLKWIRNEGLFNIEMVKYLPELKWEDITFKKIKEYKADSADYEIRVTYSNTGQLPTALKQANLVRIVSEDKVSVSFDRPSKDEGKAAIEVIDPASRRPGRGEMGGPGEPQGQRGRLSASKNSGYAQGGEKNTAVFKIRIRGIEEVKGKATVSSTRGGILKEKEFSLKLK